MQSAEHQNSPPKPPYEPDRGQFYWWLGVIIIGIGFLVACAGGLPRPQSGPLLFTGIGGMLVGVKIWYRGKQYTATPGEIVESRDPRPPVVFLKSFSAEVDDKKLFSFLRNVFFGRPLAESIPSGGPYEQDQMKRLFEKIGPFLTVGRPGEPFADLGPARFHLPDDEWQAFVESRMKRARLVLVRAGTTVTSQPAPASWRRMLSLMPASKATTRCRAVAAAP